MLVVLCKYLHRCSAINIKRALLSSAKESEHLNGLVKTNGHLDIMKAAQELGLASAATTLQQQEDIDDLRECKNGAKRMMGSAYIIALLTTFVLWREL